MFYPTLVARQRATGVKLEWEVVVRNAGGADAALV